MTPAGGDGFGRDELVRDELVRLEVGPVAHGGHCVSRHEGRVVFVRHALPGETVLARFTQAQDKAKFWRADAVEIVTASPDRVEPPCPWAGPGECGGCDWQHASPAAQRALKAAVVEEQLTRLAGLDRQVVVEEVYSEALAGAVAGGLEGGPGEGLGWRTRVRFAVDGEGRAGLRRHRSHEVVAIDDCRIAVPAINDLKVTAQRWPDADGVETIAPARVSSSTRSTESTVDDDPLVIAEAVPGGRGEKLRVPHLQASMATRDADGLHRVRGRTWVAEQVEVDGADRSFRVTGGGFWQVHPAAAQTLLDAVLAAADPRAGESALDLYCGVGLFAAGLASRVGEGGSVLAVESQERAIKDARRSLHDLPQVRFEAELVDRVLGGLARQQTSVDIVVLDPPRSGAGRYAMQRITGLRPRVVVYVACDPAALARDLRTAAAAGYELTDLRAFDLFPMTHHVECVATLEPLVS